MDKKLLIDSYLQGKRPIEHEPWSLPSESELDRDEALYDALLAERRKASLLNRKRWGWLLAAAAVVVAVLTLVTWKSFMPNSVNFPTASPTASSSSMKKTPKSVWIFVLLSARMIMLWNLKSHPTVLTVYA